MDADALQDCFSSVLAEAEIEQAADARAVAEAVYASVALADRLRAALGLTVVLQVGGESLVGRLADINREAVVIEGAGGSRCVVRAAAIELVRGLPEGHRPEPGSITGRLGLAAALRPLVGARVACAAPGGQLAGLLRRVGADHIELLTPDGAAVVVLGALGWVRAA